MNSGANLQPDDDTVRRFIAGDVDAFNLIHEWLAPQVLAYLNSRLSNSQDAEDVHQTMWEEAWKKRNTFDGRNIRAWVFEIARNRMIDETRRHKRRGNVEELTEDAEPSSFLDPSASVQRVEELAAFRDCMKSIGGIFISALLKTKLMGQSPEELAAEAGVSRATIDTRVNRGKKQIEECLKEKGFGKQ